MEKLTHLAEEASLWPDRPPRPRVVRSVILRARVDPRRKAAAERILRRLGLTLPQFVVMSLAQLELRQGLPFPVHLRAVELPPSESG